MSAHARLGPSNKRWPQCAGSVREEEPYPDIAGDAAIDGTGSHLLLEMCLNNNVPAATYDRHNIGAGHDDAPMGWFIDTDRIKRVQMCLDYIETRSQELVEHYPKATVTVEAEQTVDPGGAYGRTDWWGTVDVTITARDSMTGELFAMEIIDYKDGRGWVKVDDNTQLISYLFGKLRPYIGTGPDLVQPFTATTAQLKMTIVQPKTTPVVRSTETTGMLLIGVASDLAKAARATDEPNAPLIPGEHCQWCKANPKRGGHCDASTQKSLEAVSGIEGHSELVEYIGKSVSDPKSLTVQQLHDFADAEAGIQAIFEKVKAEIQCRIEQGEKVPGYAMLPGNNSRIWVVDEATVVKKLKSCRLKKDDYYPPKLVSPAAMLKIPTLNDDQRERLERELVITVTGKLTLKKVSYEKPTVDEMFTELPQQFSFM